MFVHYTARQQHDSPESKLKDLFHSVILPEDKVDAIYVEADQQEVIGISGLSYKAPTIMELMKHPVIASFLLGMAGPNTSVLIRLHDGETAMFVFSGQVKAAEIPEEVAQEINRILGTGNGSAGKLNAEGEHVIDLLAPSPGPHFYVNFMLVLRMEMR